ncbi:hypothetical protein AURANDRAFT_68506, partial [Aureococcus anophagefferens]
MGASSGPDWLSGSGAPAAAPAAAAASGNMDHFASTAGSFKAKVRDFKATGASSGPDWLSGSGAPAAPPAAAATAAASGNMDHFASTAGSFKGKVRDFKATGASSGPDWLSGSGFSAAPPAAAATAAASGNMDHFASTAGAFKGKDRDFKAAGASSGPDWLSGKWAEQAEREAAWTAASVASLEQLRVAEAETVANLEQLRVAEAEAARLKAEQEALFEQQRVAEEQTVTTEQEAPLPVKDDTRSLRAEGERVLNSKWAEQAEREAAWTASSVASLEQLRVAEAETVANLEQLRVAEAEAARLKAEQEALFEQQRVAEEQTVTTEQEAPLPVKDDTRSLRAEGERVLNSKWAEQAEREAAWTASSVASLEQLRVAEAETVANLEQLRVAEAEAARLKAEQEALFEQQRVAEEQTVTTEQEAPLPAEVDTRSLRAEGQRVLESKWTEQAEREAAWTAASVASLEGLRAAEAEAAQQLRVAEAEVAQLETEQEASLPAEVDTRSLRAEGERVLESKWAEQAEREAAWIAASAASLKRLRVAEEQAAQLEQQRVSEEQAVTTEQEAPPDWLSGSAAASSAAPAEVDTRSLRADGERILESKWAEQAEREAAWTASSVASFDQPRPAEAEAVTIAEEAPLPAEVDTRSLRAEGERVLESKWAEQAEREAAWTASSVASFDQPRPAEAEAVTIAEEAPLPAEVDTRSLRAEGERVLESKWAEQAEREAAWTASSVASFDQPRPAEAEAVTIAEEAPLPAEVDTRSLRAEGERVLESKWAEQAEREAAWTASSVASFDQPRPAEAEAATIAKEAPLPAEAMVEKLLRRALASKRGRIFFLATAGVTLCVRRLRRRRRALLLARRLARGPAKAEACYSPVEWSDDDDGDEEPHALPEPPEFRRHEAGDDGRGGARLRPADARAAARWLAATHLGFLFGSPGADERDAAALRAAVLARVTWRRYRDGATILERGAARDALVLVVSGVAELYEEADDDDGDGDAPRCGALSRATSGSSQVGLDLDDGDR